jgi:8-oxo-dGTP pyrophosphatase MutT (NUDIX family)
MQGLDFDPGRTGPAPRPAATVIVLREAGEGLEVFCVRRHQKSGFMGGAVVFPGGKVDAKDASELWTELSSEPHPRTAAMVTDDAPGRALAVAASRECLEEAAIGPLDQALPDEDILAMRGELEGGRALPEILRARGVRLATHALVPWARWITPEAESRRFDARFFLLALPSLQRGAHDERETVMSFWASPAAVLDRFLRGELWLAPPTCRSLELLSDCGSLQSAFELADAQSLLPVCPRAVLSEDGLYLALPGDPSHEVGEKRVSGKTRFVLRDGRLVSEDP